MLKMYRKRGNTAVEIRNNDNLIISRTKIKLIVGSSHMVLNRLHFVAKKVEIILISENKIGKIVI